MKKPVSFLWRYLPWHLLLIISSLTVLTVFASITLKNIYMERIIEGLTTRSQLLFPVVQPHLKSGDFARVQTICDSLGSIVPGRFTVITADGTVVGDSDEHPSQMENHADRPEITEALHKGIGTSTRFSRTLKISMLYVAASFEQADIQPVVIRCSLPLTALTSTLNNLYQRFAIVLILVILGAALITFLISKRIRRPIAALIDGSERFSRGELDHRMHISDPLELLNLGRAMNSMAAQLKDRIATMNRQQREMKSVLSGMSEALIAVGPDGKIVRFNPAAGALFGISPEQAIHRTLQEVVRNMDLLRFVEDIRSADRSADHESVIHMDSDRFLQVRGSMLAIEKEQAVSPDSTDAAAENDWILLVLNDITRIKRLETVRKDFVANVSHELKTPITAISAAAETLISGAVDDRKNGGRFLQIIRKHTIRLHNLVEDLLQISRLEDPSRTVKQALDAQPLAAVAREAVSVCKPAAQDKQITLTLVADDDISAPVHTPTLEQALINLIDNAIKYSPAKTEVTVSITSRHGRACITVQDQGEGIPAEHQSRIFERFYRIDKSRSREQGGTGLGLAIVKHAVSVLNGEIAVESTPGQGSRFTITLPAGQ